MLEWYFKKNFRSPKVPRRTSKRRRTKEKWASAHTAVRAIILRDLIWRIKLTCLSNTWRRITSPFLIAQRRWNTERVHALVVGTSNSPSFIIDSGASRHMISKKEEFSSVDMLKSPPIVLGDESLTDSLGKGRIDLDQGKFNNVLFVPGLSSNILSVYHMTHTGSLLPWWCWDQRYLKW